MMNQAVNALVPPRPYRHFKRIEGEIGTQVISDLPAENAAGEQVHNERRVHKPGGRVHVRDVRDPAPVRRHSVEAAVQQVRRPVRGIAGHRGARRLPPAPRAADPQVAHQPLHRVACHRNAFPVQLQPHFPGSVNLSSYLAFPYLHDLVLHDGIPGFPCRRLRLAFLREVIRRHGKLQDRADRLDAKPVPVRVNELDWRGSLGSSSRAKYALAALRISFARRSSRTSRSSSVIRLLSTVVVPGRWPPSISACFSQPRSASGWTSSCRPTRAISPRPLPSRSRTSSTNFTARSRSSSGYFRCAAMTLNPPRYQSLQPSRGDPFLIEAAGWAARQGIGQFIDLGAGLPASPSVHQAARAVRPAARVAYVDIDPVVLSHAVALLATDDGVTAVAADLRDPAAVLAYPELRAVIDLREPGVRHPRRGPALPRRRCRPAGDR